MISRLAVTYKRSVLFALLKEVTDFFLELPDCRRYNPSRGSGRISLSLWQSRIVAISFYRSRFTGEKDSFTSLWTLSKCFNHVLIPNFGSGLTIE